MHLSDLRRAFAVVLSSLREVSRHAYCTECMKVRQTCVNQSPFLNGQLSAILTITICKLDAAQQVAQAQNHATTNARPIASFSKRVNQWQHRSIRYGRADWNCGVISLRTCRVSAFEYALQFFERCLAFGNQSQTVLVER